MTDEPKTKPRMQAVYYRAADRSEPVRMFIEALKGRRPVVIDNQIKRLNLCRLGEHLPVEYSHQVEGELRELRCHYGNELYRIYYRQSHYLFVLLHILRKNTGALPVGDTKIAKERWADFRRRMDAKPRKPPRAIGGDAP